MFLPGQKMLKNTKICIALFVVGLCLLALADNLRPWRRLQVEFYALELENVQNRLAAIQKHLDSKLHQAQEAVEAERRLVAEKEAESTRLAKTLRTLRGKEERARFRWQEARDALHQGAKTSGDGSVHQSLSTELREARRELEAWQGEIAEQEEALHRFEAALIEAQAEEETLLAEMQPLQRRVAQLRPGASRRTWPILGLFDPLVTPQTVTLKSLPLPPPNAGAPRVDRCVTCHVGTPQPGFEEFSAPFGSHPRLDLFVSEDSPHPYSKMGCTVCHGGEGRATSFDRAGHLPRDPDQEAIWRQEWGYRPERLPPRPLLPLAFVDAGCAACHGPTGDLPAAPALEAGRHLGQRLGCGGCHPSLAEDPEAPLRGPSLLRLRSKTRPSWVARFLEDPKAFRPTTWMPHHFTVEEVDPRRQQRRAAEIQAVVTYLFATSQTTTVEPAPNDTSEDVGRRLFESVGCTACHTLDPQNSRSAYAPRFSQLQGPHLARMGNKVEAGWLYSWLRDPRAHRPDTPMPNLRLNKAEAAALTTFLMAQTDREWEDTWQSHELPALDPVVRDALVLEHLEQEFSLRQSAARFEAMSGDERTLYLGKRLLTQEGCHGCHDIAGFENTPSPTVPIPQLTAQAAKSWAEGASNSHHDSLHRNPPLHGPSLSNLPSDSGKVATNAPHYDLSDQERSVLTTWLLASQMPQAPAYLLRTPPALTAGRQLIDRYGCRGCHAMDNRGGFPETEKRPEQAPPTLINEGQRVRPSWLLAFLRNPGEHPVRPWLEVRMPEFAFSDQQLATLVQYFVERDNASLLETPPPIPSTIEQIVGAVYFDLLHCTRCHHGQEDSGGLQVPEFAPNYHLAQQRLRAKWVEEWILAPTSYVSETSMPALVGDDSDSSFLLHSLNAPMFYTQKARLQRVLKNEESLAGFLEDPQRVAQALRAHIWSLDTPQPTQ